MAVQGFKFSDGTVVKYDYSALDNITTDKTLSIENAAADGKAVGEELTTIKADLQDIQEEIEGGGSGMSEDFKQALHDILEKVAYIDEDGQDYLDALDSAMWPPADLVSISAVYTQSGTVYDTDTLDSLKADLVVTAHMSDSTTQTVTTYTLSGTLTEGTSTITVSYGGKTTTFTVEVTASRLPAGYTAYDYIIIVAASKANIKNRGIKTDIQLSPTYSLETKIKYPTGQTHLESTCLMGTRTSQSGIKQFGLFVKPSENKLGYWFGGTDSTTTIPIVADSVNTIKVKPVGKSTNYPNNAVIEVDGTEYSTGSTQGSGTWSSWFGLMQYQISATALNGYDAWSSLIQQGEIIIKDYLNNVLYDFIPASNGTIYGFYEAVNDIFYYDENYFAEYACGNWE